jgi:CRP-like cAMP-binding protein
MNTHLLRAHIGKHISLSEAEWAHFQLFLKEEEVSKGAYILRQGEPCQAIHFVNEGMIRAFHLTPDGKDATVMFATADWWITDMYCFLLEQPAMVTIQAVHACSLLKLTKTALDQLYIDLPQFNVFFRVLMQNAYCREQLRVIQNLSLPAKERYDLFLTKYPQIAKHLTQKHIASYLGITPEFLSVIRSSKKV